MKFKYNARTKTGELQVGYVEAINRDVATSILQKHELYLLSLEEVRVPGWYLSIVNFFRRVKIGDLMIFTRQLATMLEAEMPLTDALQNLQRQTKNPLLKEAVFDISSDIDAGLSLSQALEKHSNIFSEFYINLIRSAEVTGRMEEVMTFLADYLEKQLALTSRVRNAMIYPAFVVGLFVVVAGILIGVVFPQLAPIFSEANVELPILTKILLVSGNFVANWWWALIIGAVMMIILLVDYFRSSEGKVVFDQILLKVPVFGNLFKKIYVSRFAEGMKILIKGGIPITQAMEIAGHTIDSSIYQEEIHVIAESVRGGELLSQSLARSPVYFPALVSQMVAVGESTGKTEEMFGRIADFYNREVNDAVSNLVELIQPTLMVVMGVMVGLLFASMLIPIYNLVQVF